VHTASGGHVAKEIRYPDWVSPEIAAQASDLNEEDALKQLGHSCAKAKPLPQAVRRKKRSG